MIIRDIMLTDVMSVTSDTGYGAVAKLLQKEHIGSLPVCDNNGKLVGIISEKDLFRAMFPNYGDYYETPESLTDEERFEDKISELRDHPIREYMVTKVFSMHSQEPIMKAGGLMLARHMHRIPVVDNGKLVGMISREDVFSAILKKHLKL